MQKVFCFLLFSLFTTATVFASDPMIWQTNTRADFLKGEARGVSITDTGSIVPAPKLAEMFNTQQSYVWSSAIDGAGNIYLGTGNDGKIFKVDAGGTSALFSDLVELDVSALAVGKDGALYAGTSPDGKVYRIDASGKAEVYFDPSDKYIWSLAAASDGSLVIGTGENGKIYRVRAANAKPETSLAFDSSDTHIITLAADNSGNVYAGTDSNGLVLKIGSDNKAFALLDAPLREIHDIVISPDGTIYALALGDSVATSRPAGTVPVPDAGPPSTGPETPQEQPPAKSKYDLSAAKSAVFRISPDGNNDVVWNSPNVVAFSLYAHLNNNGVLVGTSDKGRIYNLPRDGGEVLVLQSGEGQISTILTNGRQLFATSSNQGKLYRFGPDTNTESSFESNVKDAKTNTLWGRVWWRSNGNVSIQTRTGNTAKPDETWSDWSAPLADQKGGQIASPRARYMQWKAVLRGDSALNEVNVSYISQNLAPEILAIQITPNGVGLGSNPPIQLDPNIETSGLDPSVFGIMISPIPPRKLYQRGARGIQWTAEDRNGDKMEFSVYYRELGESNFKLLRSGLTESFVNVDGLSLADGTYIFKIVANDSPSNPATRALSGERVSEAITIDNTAPVVSSVGAPQINGERARVMFEAVDTASFVQHAEYSVDGGPWQSVYSDDGISDSGRERYTFDIPVKTAGEYSVTLRAFDSAGNVGNARVLVKR